MDDECEKQLNYLIINLYVIRTVFTGAGKTLKRNLARNDHQECIYS